METLCLHNRHVCHLLAGLLLNNSRFTRWSPKLWILPCTYLGLLLTYTHLRKSGDRSQCYNLWWNSWQHSQKGMRTKVAKDGVVLPLVWNCRIWRSSRALQSPSSCHSPKRAPESHRIRKVWHIVAKLALPPTHPLPWEGVGKISAIWGTCKD